jgi:hypothetical protein
MFSGFWDGAEVFQYPIHGSRIGMATLYDQESRISVRTILVQIGVHR